MSRVAAWWSSLGFGKSARATEHDYADMGTAFGLDASMDTVPAAYNPPSSGYPEAAHSGWTPAERSPRPGKR
jgi:hypothetical protein